MKKYVPLKDTYFIVRKIMKPSSTSELKAPSGMQFNKRVEIIIPEEFILYHCVYCVDNIVKGQPIRTLGKKVQLFDTAPAQVFDAAYTEFWQAPPEVLKDCVFEIMTYEGKTKGFEESDVMILPSNAGKSDEGFKPMFEKQVTDAGGFQELMVRISKK